MPRDDLSWVNRPPFPRRFPPFEPLAWGRGHSRHRRDPTRSASPPRRQGAPLRSDAESALGIIPDPATRSRVVSRRAGVVMRIESVFRRMVHVNWPWYAPQDERLHDEDHRDHHAGHRCGDRSRFRCRILTYSGPSGRPDNPTTAFRAAWLSMSKTDLSSNCAGRSTTPDAWSSRPGRQMDPDLLGSPRCSDLAARRSAFSVIRRRGRVPARAIDDASKRAAVYDTGMSNRE